MKNIAVGVVGATGVVGETFLRILEERKFPVSELRLFASENSEGQTRKFRGIEIPVRVLGDNCFAGLDLVFFSSGDDISKTWAPRAVAQGAHAVDNSAAFRLDSEILLVVPEVNGGQLTHLKAATLIANPNCSTIQLVVALKPLQQKFGLAAVRVASYQSVSGAGRNGVEELFSQTKLALEGETPQKGATFPKAIAFDCIPQIGGFNDDGFCSEEVKIMRETCKIMNEPGLPVSAFTVRVPTMNSHAEAVWVTLKKEASKEELEAALKAAEGIKYIAISDAAIYPTQTAASGRDPVFVGRLRRDPYDSKTWLMWVVADNLRKGAALNGMQIAERIFDISPVQ